jgi:hypothetical protein
MYLSSCNQVSAVAFGGSWQDPCPIHENFCALLQYITTQCCGLLNTSKHLIHTDTRRIHHYQNLKTLPCTSSLSIAINLPFPVILTKRRQVDE